MRNRKHKIRRDHCVFIHLVLSLISLVRLPMSANVCHCLPVVQRIYNTFWSSYMKILTTFSAEGKEVNPAERLAQRLMASLQSSDWKKLYRHQEQGSYTHRVPPGALLAAPGCSWLFLAAHGCSWLPLAAFGCSWRCSWLLLAALLAAPGCFWLFLAAPCCSWLLFGLLACLLS